ncbi:MAG: TIR domain-containing protein [Thermoguttaceae bacterium]|jgi:hypothetical protein
MSYDMFISYASGDEQIARRIVESLQGYGLRCWIDKQNLRFTGKYDREIERAIRASRMVLWLASPRSIASDYVKFEIATAVGNNKLIGPVYLEPMDAARMPAPFNLKLANVQGIQWFEGPEEATLERLATEVRVLVDRVRRRKTAAICGIGAGLLLLAALAVWQLLPLWRGANIPNDPSQGSLQSSGPWQTPAATPLPAAVAQLPAADVLKIAYSGYPPAAPTDGERPALDFAILARRHTETSFAQLKDGAALPSEKDDYFLVARPLTRGFLYVFQVDSAGKKTWLFPKNATSKHSSGSNPVEARKVLQVPSVELDRVLFLDTTPGIEHVYAVFSATPWAELERALSHPKPAPEKPGRRPDPSLLAATVRSPNGLALRGVGGTRLTTGAIGDSFVVQRMEGQKSWSLPLASDPILAGGSFLVIERWFEHVEF